jgi:hypothetical protein
MKAWANLAGLLRSGGYAGFEVFFNADGGGGQCNPIGETSMQHKRAVCSTGLL